MIMHVHTLWQVFFYKGCVTMQFNFAICSWYCDRRAQVARMLSFTLWQQAAIEVTCHAHCYCLFPLHTRDAILSMVMLGVLNTNGGAFFQFVPLELKIDHVNVWCNLEMKSMNISYLEGLT